MKIVIFGLSISSSWGNGHATLWRGILRALAAGGHEVVFYERDVAYYAQHRDLTAPPGYALRLYRAWSDVEREVDAVAAEADVVIVTSYCPDAIAASRLLEDCARPRKVFYDLDTPVTIEAVRRGEAVFYLPPGGLGLFDLVLSYTGGRALTELRQRLGARRAEPLYGSVDPAVHNPAPARAEFTADLSYLGTYAADRQEKLATLFLAAAARLPGRDFLIGGALYPADFPWAANIRFWPHVAPPEHPAFYGSSRLTLNITRSAMAAYGHCPSGRLFEAAACRAALLSDSWEGLDAFFTPGEELLTASTTREAVAALSLAREETARLAERAYQRVMDQHTAAHRARELVALLESISSPPAARSLPASDPHDAQAVDA